MNQLLASFILVLIVFASSLPVAAVGPEEEVADATASRTAIVVAVDASPQSPLALLPLEIHFKIFESLSPKEVNSVALISKVMEKIVSGFRAHCRETYQHDVKTVMRVHESNPAGYGLPLFASRIEMEARIPSQKPQQVPSAYKEEVFWRGECRVSFDIFAATPNNPVYALADRMADYQKANMATVMLAAMYSAEAPPSYLEKVAIHHLFSAYTVFHKEEGLAEWQQLLPSKKERLQQFIEKTYVEFEPGQVPAVRPDQKLVVKRGQLDTAANIAALDGIFQPDQPQPEMVLDFNGRDQIARLGNENLPAYLTNLAIVNSGGAVTAIGDDFLLSCQSLETLTLSLPQVTQVGDWFLFSCQRLDSLTLDLPQLTQVGGAFLYDNPSLTTLTMSLPQVTQVGERFLSSNRSLETLMLSLPQLMQVGDGFLSNNQSLNALTLNLPQLTQVRGYFLSGCHQLKFVDLRSLLNLEKVEVDRFMDEMTNLEQVLIDARQEEFFKELLKDKPDLLSKLVVA